MELPKDVKKSPILEMKVMKSQESRMVPHLHSHDIIVSYARITIWFIPCGKSSQDFPAISFMSTVTYDVWIVFPRINITLINGNYVASFQIAIVTAGKIADH